MASVMQPTPSASGNQRELYNLIIAELEGHQLEDAASDFLWDEFGKGLRRLEAEGDEKARLLEFRENCSTLGRSILEESREVIRSGAPIPETLVRQSIVKLCPGFFPFC